MGKKFPLSQVWSPPKKRGTRLCTLECLTARECIRGELKRSRSSCAKCSVRDIRVVTKWTCSPTAWEMRSRKQEILTRSFSLAQDLANASAREFPSVRYWHCCAWLDTWALTFRSEIVPCRWARTCPIFSHKSALSNWPSTDGEKWQPTKRLNPFKTLMQSVYTVRSPRKKAKQYRRA